MHVFSSQRYDSMIYRKCGRWGLKLPAISLGAWETFGGYRGEETARSCMFRAFELGVTHFDLANNYGKPPGNAEQLVGKILKEMPRDELIISSKAGYLMWPGPYGNWGSRKYLMSSLDQSLKRLGLDYVDIFYHHRPDPDTPIEESIGALNDIVRSGKAIYAGISNYPGALADSACSLVAECEWAPIIIHQPRYHLLEQKVQFDLLPAARQHGFGIIVFSPLASGLLTDKYLNGIPAESRAANETVAGPRLKTAMGRQDIVRRLRALNEIARQRGQTLAQMALAWVLRLPEVTSALIGASRVEQVEENVATLRHLEFSSDELRLIEELTMESNSNTSTGRSITPNDPLAGFVGQDIGSPHLTGSSKPSETGWDAVAGGADIWEKSDQFHFVHKKFTGDFDIAVRVESFKPAHLYSKAGIMVREQLGADSRHVMFLVFSDNSPRNNNLGGYEMQFRATAGGDCRAIYPAVKPPAPPEFPVAYPNCWLRVQRRGNRFLAFVSTDGHTWKGYGEHTLALPEQIFAGPALTSHEPQVKAEARFRNYTEQK